MKILLTGCAGFVGSNLLDNLIKKGHYVIGIDNLSTGKIDFINEYFEKNNFKFFQSDLREIRNLMDELKDIEMVYHLAANADVRFGLSQPTKDLNQNTVNTCILLELMRELGIKNIMFASTGSIYGNTKEIPTTENCSFPTQTSLYGASKIAAEGFLSAYCEGYEFNAVSCRFVSLMGPRYTHGHVFDFVESLIKDSKKLKILGDGKQYKSYFHVSDCINAMIILTEKIFNGSIKGYLPVNLGTEESITVENSASIICKVLNKKPKFIFTGGRQGWIGDNPRIQLDISRAKSFGWIPKIDIYSSIEETTLWVYDYLTNKK